MKSKPGVSNKFMLNCEPRCYFITNLKVLEVVGSSPVWESVMAAQIELFPDPMLPIRQTLIFVKPLKWFVYDNGSSL